MARRSGEKGVRDVTGFPTWGRTNNLTQAEALCWAGAASASDKHPYLEYFKNLKRCSFDSKS